MTEKQEAVLLRLVKLLKAHDVDLVTIDEVLDLWCASCAHIRFTIPRPRKMRPRRRFIGKIAQKNPYVE